MRYQSADEDSGRWTGFPFRDGDIVISTRSKSGTTWVQMICALLVFQSTKLPASLGELSPWLDFLGTPKDEVFERLATQDHRRFIKTHTPLDGIPVDDRATYVVVARHPLDMAVSLVVNSKTQRPSVCNAAESLVLHADVAADVLPRIAEAMPQVELVGDERSRVILPSIGVATEEDFATEFLDLKMSVAVVDDLDAAIDWVQRNSSGHSEAIVTTDLAAANRFTREVDAAAVLVNASTRWVDGERFGFGAEIGISTQKLHARGPMGLRELSTRKFVIRGDGQTRT